MVGGLEGERERNGEEDLPDRVSGTETDPLRNGAVGLLGLGQLDLGAERLVALWGMR